jgi:hypothetical protein
LKSPKSIFKFSICCGTQNGTIAPLGFVMDIKLTNVKIYKAMSEETICFSANLVIDGEKSGGVSNDGHGGANRYDSRETEDLLNEHAKTLPPAVFKSVSYPMDADSIVSGLIDRYETGIHFKRLLKDRVILLMKNGDIANYKGKFDIKLSESACIEKLKQSNIHSVRILNFMDFEDIITLGLAETSERMDLLAKMPKMKAKTPVTGPAP